MGVHTDDPVTGDVIPPAENQRDGETQTGRDPDQADGFVREWEGRGREVGDLNEHPRRQYIKPGDMQDAPSA